MEIGTTGLIYKMHAAPPNLKTEPRRKKRRPDHLKRLRDLVAAEILGNCANTLGPLHDMRDDINVLELSDEYSIRLLIEWVCTRYGCDPYARYVQPGRKDQSQSFADLLEKHQLYPFLNSDQRSISSDLREAAYSLMNECVEPSIELVGTLYEYICACPLRWDHERSVGAAPDIWMKAARRMVGQFYTPKEIAHYCFERYLESDSIKFMSVLKSSRVPAVHEVSEQAGGDSTGTWKMLDPACGTGNFLICAVRMAAESGCRGDQLLEYVGNSIYGIDLDGKAVAIARISVVVELLRWAPDIREQTSSEADRSVGGSDPLNAVLESMRHHVTVGDSVLHVAGNRLNHGQNSFDLVVTNPPYVSFGSRNQPEILQSQRTLLKQFYPEAAEYKVRLHSLFQDLALRLCRDGGQAVLFVPDAFLTGSFYANLRRMLLAKSEIVSISEFPESTMPGAVVGRWCVAQYRKRINEGPRKNYLVQLQSFCQGERLHHEAQVEAMVSPDKARFILLFSQADEEIIKHVGGCEALGKQLRGHTGIRSMIGQRAIISSKCESSHWHRGIKSGAQLTQSAIMWDGTWLQVKAEILFKGGFDRSIISNAKVFVRQTGDRLIAAVDESGLYHLNNVHSFSTNKISNANADGGVPKIDLYFACALMNSNFWLYLYQLITREQSRPLAQIDIETVESLPLPPQNLAIQNNVSKLSRFCHAGKVSPIDSRSRTAGSAEASDLQLLNSAKRSIDRYIYELYDLPDPLIEHVERYCRHTNAKKEMATELPSHEQAEQILATMERAD